MQVVALLARTPRITTILVFAECEVMKEVAESLPTSTNPNRSDIALPNL